MGERFVFQVQKDGLRFGESRYSSGDIVDPQEFSDRDFRTLVERGDLEEMRIPAERLERIRAEEESEQELAEAVQAAQEAREAAYRDARQEYAEATAEADQRHDAAVQEARQAHRQRLSEIQAE